MSSDPRPLKNTPSPGEAEELDAMTREDLMALFEGAAPADVSRLGDVEFIGWLCQWTGNGGGPHHAFHQGHWTRNLVTSRGVHLAPDGKTLVPCPSCRPVFVGSFQ